MRFFDFLEKLRMEKKDVFEENIAKIRDVYLSKIEEEITKYGWERTTILKQLFDWYTEPIAGEIPDKIFTSLYLSVKKDLTKLSQRIRLMQPTVKKKQKKENPNSDKETTLIPILIRSNYNHEKEIEHKKQIIVKKNEEISKNFSLDWAKKYSAGKENWKTDGLDENQTKTVDQIKRDICRNGDYHPLIFALKQLATWPPKNYEFGQDDTLYLEWNLRKGLINLKDNTWIDPVISKIKNLSEKVIKLYFLSASYQNLDQLINSKTIKPLNKNLTLVSIFRDRADHLKKTINEYMKGPSMLDDEQTALSLLQALVSNFFLIKECADEIGYRFFVKGQTMSAQELFNYIINTIKKACTAEKAKTKKNKK